MALLLQFVLLFTSISGTLATATHYSGKRQSSSGACSSNTTQIVPWSNLTSAEKSSYLDAAVCLTKESAKLGLGGSKTRWDEIQYQHIKQVSWIHFVGQFLPWHRYFISVHRSLLRDECSYHGPLPYWDEIADSELSDISDSVMWQDDSFGKNGTGTDLCIDSGPFSSVNLTFAPGLCTNPGCVAATADDHCIFRAFDTSAMQENNQSLIDKCQAKTTFEEFWDCTENGVHANGHRAVSGLMGSTAYSPGDPIFFLHHAFIDLQWWRWQSQDLDTRLTEIGGINSPSEATCEEFDETCPGSDILDYNGDPGNTTTLDHVLWLMEIYPNVTARDVMNINSSHVCFEYHW